MSEEQNQVHRFTHLLQQFQTIASNAHAYNAKSKHERFTTLLTKFKPYVDDLKKQHSITTPHYNVFNIFKYDYNEVKIHTPLLHNFLSINGTHAQGHLFFDAFLKQILNQSDNVFTRYQEKYLQVKNEFSIPGGFIDIFILHTSPNRDDRFAIIFENKLKADDGVAQLDKYYRYAKSTLNLNDAQILVVYLKPNMSDPSEMSISTQLREQLLSQNTLKTIGYNPHIKNWLTLCSTKIESEKLKQTIVQYIELIKQITYEEADQ